MSDSFDGAVALLASKGPEFGPGLSNHGPMAADALTAMGRSDVVEDWATWYATRLDEAPQSRNAIASDDWREALGDIRRVGDWSAFFRQELAERPWQDVLETWASRLAPGIMAGATHGVLRTAHAVRAIDRAPTPLRIGELGEGLAYWASRYQELPTALAASAGLPVREALREVELIPPSQRGAFLIFDAVKRLDADSFAPAINAIRADEVDAFVRDVTRTFVRQYLVNAHGAAIAFVHTVTAPSALRIIAPHLGDETTRRLMRYVWQACAAIYAAYARPDATPPPDGVGAGFDREDLIQQAVAARDEHAIKFTDACLREHDISDDAAFIVAAQDIVRRLRVT